jgi:hypothetical protein
LASGFRGLAFGVLCLVLLDSHFVLLEDSEHLVAVGLIVFGDAAGDPALFKALRESLGGFAERFGLPGRRAAKSSGDVACWREASGGYRGV